MFGGSDETQLIFMADGVVENRNNVFKILGEILGFPLQIDGFEIKVSADLKLSCILTGLHACNARHGCIYCEGYKSPNDTSGRWVGGEHRTNKNCVANFEKWMRETGGDEDRLKQYCSNKHKPIKIFRNEDDDTPFLILYPPPLLHLLLGKYDFFSAMETNLQHFLQIIY